MCRTLVEIYYECNHMASWEIPSPDPLCNGIRHNLVYNHIKPCKHCWIFAGYTKASWRRALSEKQPKETRRERYDWDRHHVSIPIQSKTCVQETECPTWAQSYPWRSREWAHRLLILAAIDDLERKRENERITNEIRDLVAHPERFPPGQPTPEYWVSLKEEYDERLRIHHTDEDVQESKLFNIIEPHEVPANQEPKCMICFEEFESEEGAGPGELRQLPCNQGHVFCLNCIRPHFLTVKQRNDGHEEAHRVPYACPLCRFAWSVRFIPKRDMKSRYKHWYEKYDTKVKGHLSTAEGEQAFFPNAEGGGQLYRELRFSHWPSGWVPSVWDRVASAIICPLIIPTAMTVNHTARIWNSKNNGLPWLQVLIVGLAGLILQAIWLGPLVAATFVLFTPWTWSWIITRVVVFNVVWGDSPYSWARFIRNWLTWAVLYGLGLRLELRLLHLVRAACGAL